MTNIRRFFFFLCFAFLSSFGLSFLRAQPVWEGYNSTFHAGALDIKLPEIARRVLLLDHGHYYGTSIQTIQNQYNDTSNRRGELWRRSGSEGFRVSFNPPEYLELAFSSRVVESRRGIKSSRNVVPGGEQIIGTLYFANKGDRAVLKGKNGDMTKTVSEL